MEKVKVKNPNQLKANQLMITQGIDKGNYYPNITDQENETLQALVLHFLKYGLIPKHYRPLLKSILDKSHCVLVWSAHTITPYFFENETDYNTQKKSNEFIFA